MFPHKDIQPTLPQLSFTDYLEEFRIWAERMYDAVQGWDLEAEIHSVVEIENPVLNTMYHIAGNIALDHSVASIVQAGNHFHGLMNHVDDLSMLDYTNEIDDIWYLDAGDVSHLDDADNVAGVNVGHAQQVNVGNVKGGGKADLGNKLDYQFGKVGGNKHNVDRTAGLKAEMDKLGFDDTPENRVYFEQYYNDVLNDSSNIVGKPQTASYVENGVTYNYTVTTRESFLMGKFGGAKVTTHWDGNRLLTMKIGSGKQTRYHH